METVIEQDQTEAIVTAAIASNKVVSLYEPKHPNWGHVVYWVDSESDQVLIESSITGTQIVNQEEAMQHYLNLVEVAPTHYGAEYAIAITGRQ